MTTTLGPGDFAGFFRSVHAPPGRDEEGPDPFPWQQRLVEEVAESGRWPDLLDLPTGAGKTATIDVAVFLMALRDDAPRRIIFVVDRRVVVHQAALRAGWIARRLAEQGDDAIGAVADRLRRLSGTPNAGRSHEDRPLITAELRGGLVRDETWALRPDVPAVLVSTVDQVGSRLLFRGYGVSRAMRPVHAGLLANDALFLLDEVHLAQPFSETLRSISQRYRPPETSGLPDRWQVAELSATPGDVDAGRRVFSLDPAADLNPDVCSMLARRVAARKPFRTRPVKVTGSDAAERSGGLAEACAEEARGLVAEGVQIVGVVVNRVDTARRAHRLLSGHDGHDAVLLTGRMRPFDRDDLFAGVIERLRTGRVRRPDDRPLVVVATQTIEAGADLDLDAVVTECASLDALRQRFGRVDRDGRMSDSGHPATSVVVATSGDVAVGAEDPVYGSALAATWSWVEKTPVDDFGITACPEPSAEQLRGLVAPRSHAPHLLPSHLDRWVQTSPVPVADPDVAHWLHGLEPIDADVTVVWRADLSRELLEAEKGHEWATTVVSACPPGAGEAVQLPLGAAGRWLATVGSSEQVGADLSVADVEGAPPADVDARLPQGLAPVLRWRGDDESDVVTRRGQLRPGDTLVVPADYGGLWEGTWDPNAPELVEDLGHRVDAEQRGRATLRLAPGLLPPGVPEAPLPEDVDRNDLDDTVAVRHWLDETHGVLRGIGAMGRIVASLRAAGPPVEVTRVVVDLPHPEGDRRLGSMFVVSSRVPVLEEAATREGSIESVDSEPETSSFAGVAVSLRQHLRDVEGWARSLTAACRIPATIAQDVALAAFLHDIGKIDPRFQLILRDGRAATAESDDPLAKSASATRDRAMRRRLAQVAGYPRGSRHELLSLALIQEQEDLQARAHDWDLVLHLVASHHGYARPFVPTAVDSSPVSVEFEVDGVVMRGTTGHDLARLDSGVADRFWHLVRRYGWFGLAWLESVMRLSDHRASAAEQLPGEGFA